MFGGTGTTKAPMSKRISTAMRVNIIRGLIVVVPVGLTIYIIQFFYDITAGYLAPFVRETHGRLPEILTMVFSVALFFGLLYMLGVIAAATAGRRIIALFEFFIRKIPLVKSIYGASKQVVEVIRPKEAGTNYEASVLVDFPFPGVKTVAFITGRLVLQDGREYFRVFVPTTPNPTSGYLEIYPVEGVQSCGLSVEDAAKAAMSAGILMPETINDGPLPERERREPSSPERRPEKVQEKPSYWSRNKVIIRNRLLSGLFLLLPLASTVIIVRFIFGLTVARVTPVTSALIVDKPQWALMGLSVVVLMVGLWVIGAIATAVVGQRLIALGEYIIRHIPMVRGIYGASKQIVGTLAMQNEGPGSRLEAAVFVEFPYPGVRSVGFLVGRVRCSGGTEMCKIFMPTAPNISVGIFLMYRPEDVFLCGLSVDEAIRMVVSLGILCPDRMTLTPVGSSGAEIP